MRPHYFRIRIFACPQLKLLDRLCQQHLNSAKRVTSSFPRLTNEFCLKWIVNEIVSQPHSPELRRGYRRGLFKGALHAQRRSVYRQIEIAEVGVRELPNLNVKFLCEQAQLYRVSRKHGHFGAFVSESPQRCPRATARTKYCASGVLQ